MSASVLQPDKIKIVDFKIVTGQIDSPFEFDISKIEGHTFEVVFDMGFNYGEKLIKASFNIKVVTKSTMETEEASGKFGFVYVYRVENFEELAKLESDDTVTLHQALGNAIASITYSTSRGILMSRFQGTAMRDFILPIIDPNKLLEK